MYKSFIVLVFVVSMFSGCASVPMESKDLSAKAKEFNAPSEGTSGLYIYRTSGVGSALKKDIWVDDKCIGETAPEMFFYEEVEGNQEHKISTESEFSPNELLVTTESGKNYFIKQFIKMGVFVGGANLELSSIEQGKKDLSEIDMAIKGNCSK
ncbi:MAG: hypothetical protein ACI9T9_000348 [Oleiphilaceae bacterium]|jgi:hypothetical protein